MQQPTMLRLLDSGEQGGDPGLEAGQAFVSGREHPGGDQDVSEVVGGSRRRVGGESGNQQPARLAAAPGRKR
ncbi:MAG: hypothetical protein QOI39_2073 [Mycobacterium sp.]|nr:hypothetical protein [Mycobacterium sp.]